jgi:hypothetical protein
VSDNPANKEFPSAKELGINFEELPVEELIEAFAQSGMKKGGKFFQWIEWRFKHLHEFHIESDIQKLGQYGLCRETLGVSMFLIQLAPAMDHFFKDMFGNKKTRLRNAHSLATAAAVLEGMNNLIPDMPDTMSGLPSPSSTGKAVKHYATMLVWAEAIYAFIGARL